LTAPVYIITLHDEIFDHFMTENTFIMNSEKKEAIMFEKEGGNTTMMLSVFPNFDMKFYENERIFDYPHKYIYKTIKDPIITLLGIRKFRKCTLTKDVTILIAKDIWDRRKDQYEKYLEELK